MSVWRQSSTWPKARCVCAYTWPKLSRVGRALREAHQLFSKPSESVGLEDSTHPTATDTAVPSCRQVENYPPNLCNSGGNGGRCVLRKPTCLQLFRFPSIYRATDPA